jgi:type 1 glutamine amidotransferase
MKRVWWCLLLVLVSLSAAEPTPIRILIVDGFSNHHWQHSTKLLTEILAQRPQTTVEHSTIPAQPGTPDWQAWLPDFAAYDVVIQTTNNIRAPQLRWPRAAEVALETYVAAGGGLYVFHSANNAFPKWAAYNDMIGLGWRSADFGAALTVDPVTKAVTRIPAGTGDGTGHGRRLDALIQVVTEHPITAGYPDQWRALDLEVYHYARGPAQNLTVLSCAQAAADQPYWPIDWVVAYGAGRVYNGTFGHVMHDHDVPPAMRCLGFQTTCIRAVEWLATGSVTWPLPAEFPVASK